MRLQKKGSGAGQGHCLMDWLRGLVLRADGGAGGAAEMVGWYPPRSKTCPTDCFGFCYLVLFHDNIFSKDSTDFCKEISHISIFFAIL